jgi:hypothetical protein
MGEIDCRRTLTPADSREINTEIAEHDEVDDIWVQFAVVAFNDASSG